MTKNGVKIDMNKPRIVCAAIRSRIGNIITSARHYDHNMHQQIKAMKDPEEFYHLYADNQGFIDQFGKYYTRKEAWIIAQENNQIIREVISTPGILYSEHLY